MLWGLEFGVCGLIGNFRQLFLTKMKASAILFYFLFFSGGFLCSQGNEIVRINTLRTGTEALVKRIYKYPDFVDGRVIFHDSTHADAKLNYHQVFGQILFIAPSGDTLALANPGTTRMVIVGEDSFYYHDKAFLQMRTNFPGINLAVKSTLKYVGQEKAGPYGTYSTVASTNSNSTVTTDDQITQYIEIDQNTVYVFKHEYFLADRFNNFFRATKKGFYNIFSKNEKKIREYIKQNPVDFDKEEDLLRLLNYANSLN